MMAEKIKNLGTSETDITALKEALYAQQDLLQKLYCELDVEREAASSAASEALSMILRLQGEKAAIKMEANQYKRLAEEKMCHTEEALAIFEDLIYEKEMEIVQLVDEMGMGRELRRNSMPPSPYTVSHRTKSSMKRERSLSPDLISRTEEITKTETKIEVPDVDEELQNQPLEDIDSYWEQIKKLDVRVKEISDIKGDKSKTSALGPAKDYVARCKSPPVEPPEISYEIEKRLYPSKSTNVYDIFEVPQVQESEKVYESASSRLRLAKAKSVSQVVGRPYGEDEKLIKKMFSTKKREKMFSEGMENNFRPQRVSRMSEIVELERPGDNSEEKREEELKLLKEIQAQLNSIQNEIRSLKTEKSSPSYDLELRSISEAMMHFWL